MEYVTEKLSEESLDTIVKNQNEANQLVFELGQVALEIRDLNVKIKKLEEVKATFESRIDEISANLNATLQSLQKIYPNGEIDLKEGTVTYQK